MLRKLVYQQGTKVATMDIAGEGFDSLQVFDLDFYDRSLETSWTRLETANNLKLPWESGIWDVIFVLRIDPHSSLCHLL